MHSLSCLESNQSFYQALTGVRSTLLNSLDRRGWFLGDLRIKDSNGKLEERKKRVSRQPGAKLMMTNTYIAVPFGSFRWRFSLDSVPVKCQYLYFRTYCHQLNMDLLRLRPAWKLHKTKLSQSIECCLHEACN